MYYKGVGDAEWIQKIRSTLQSERFSEYMAAFTENVDVQDPKGNLRYLEVRAQEEAAAESEAEASGADETGSDEESGGSASSETEDGTDASASESEDGEAEG